MPVQILVVILVIFLIVVSHINARILNIRSADSVSREQVFLAVSSHNVSLSK